jgi:glycosyltransferase involved in cell wall biosynthesis/Tfp pilus assembly protein PilF
MEKRLSSSSPIADFDFEIDEEENTHNLDEFSQEELNFDISVLEDFVKDDISVEKSTNPGPKLNIVWEGSQFVYHSLALVNREHCLNILDSEQANLNIVPFEKDNFDYTVNLRYQAIQDNLVHIKKPVSDDIGNLPYVWIRHQWPTKAERPKGARWIIMQPWEYDVLLENLTNIFSYADELWTPSEFSKQSFINSGIPEDKVHVIPNGINPNVFKLDGPALSLPTEKKFKILYVGGTIQRKGIDILLKAYRKAFTAEDDVCLVIKDMGDNTFYKNQTAEILIEEFQKDKNAPEILHLTETMEEEDVASLYRTCNLFVSPYRGEGFSLPTLEAMACGLPVVVTRGGATDDFVKEKLGFFIDSEKRLVGNELDGQKFVKETYLLEPNQETLTATMQFLYTNPGILKSMGLTASYHAHSKWTWKLATLKALSRLDVLYGTDMATQAVSKLSDKKDAFYKLGYAETLYADAKYFEAYTEFKAAIAMDKLNDKWTAHAYNRLAIISIEKNDIDEAKEYITKSETFFGDSPDLLYTTAVYYSAKKDFDSALQYITVALQIWHEHKFDITLGINLDDVLVLGGDIMRAVEDLDGAVEMYKNALKINHENYFACHGAGVCFLLAEEYAIAKEMFEWALKYNPTFTPSLDALKSIDS